MRISHDFLDLNFDALLGFADLQGYPRISSIVADLLGFPVISWIFVDFWRFCQVFADFVVFVGFVGCQNLRRLEFGNSNEFLVVLKSSFLL